MASKPAASWVRPEILALTDMILFQKRSGSRLWPTCAAFMAIIGECSCEASMRNWVEQGIDNDCSRGFIGLSRRFLMRTTTDIWRHVHGNKEAVRARENNAGIFRYTFQSDLF
ncbi:hypothetical protein DL89DRAFT_67759 [Linderina pennispora]|uniref:Uncharacterized protein n=1 Tax=Linderina pennispora TaxID=61395 RepID=A0A1Y1VSM0_9FUNG|nr:uncharacterized protein DL89DRAFT_67759 [Linderina pennispora]ORX63754.1 hypothetical protein DL89DRAFT_67759 [Linderina pennispora]